MSDRTMVACKYCGIVFESNTDELGQALEDECNDCWALNNDEYEETII